MRVLIAEDDPILRCLIEELVVSWKHEVMVATDGSSALALARAGGFDVAILDWMMPGTTGVDVCRAIRAQAGERHPYVILLTAKTQLDDLVTGLDAGADEYLTKPYRPAEVAARLRAAERFLKVQDDLIAARQHIVHLVRYDVLVPALNRATFLGHLHDVLVARRKTPSPLSLVHFDIRDFSRLNETYGPSVGDEVLKRVTESVVASLPKEVAVGRVGPDELLVTLEHADEDQAELVARAIEKAVSSKPIPTSAGPITVKVDGRSVTAISPSELDEGWLLCMLEAIATVTEDSEDASARDDSGVFVLHEDDADSGQDTTKEKLKHAV